MVDFKKASLYVFSRVLRKVSPYTLPVAIPVEQIKELEEDKKLTAFQAKGMILELATYVALKELGIRPYPLHNPFGAGYAKDQHLLVDLIFIYNGELYGVECKNLSPKWMYSKEWVEREVEDRFKRLEKVFPNLRRVIVISHRRALALEDWNYILELGYEVDYHNFRIAVREITELFSNFLPKTKESPSSIIYTWGTKQRRIDEKLRG